MLVALPGSIAETMDALPNNAKVTATVDLHIFVTHLQMNAYATPLQDLLMTVLAAASAKMTWRTILFSAFVGNAMDLGKS